MNEPITRHKIYMNNSFENNENIKQKDLIQEIVACFHIRNGKINSDDSRGIIEITPRQLQNSLAYMLEQE